MGLAARARAPVAARAALGLGPGRFGTPTGAELYVLGISHAGFGRWGPREGYVLFDETAI